MIKKISIIVAALTILIVVIPLPFKPSVWSVYKEHQLNAQLKKSSDPVYIAKLTEFEPSFTIYSKWVNAYYVNTGIRFYQLSSRSVISSDSEGPDGDEANFLKKVQSGTECAKNGEAFSYCEMPSTKMANKREFVAAHKDEYVLIAELTTIFYAEGITTKGGYHLNYKKMEDADVKLILDTLSAAKPVPMSEAKTKYFAPVY